MCSCAGLLSVPGLTPVSGLFLTRFELILPVSNPGILHIYQLYCQKPDPGAGVEHTLRIIALLRC